MGGKYGVKETEDVFNVIKVMALAVIAEVKKDGFQAKDVLAFLKSSEFEASLAPALQGVEVVPLELTELDFFDGISLSRYGYGVMDEILAALKA